MVVVVWSKTNEQQLLALRKSGKSFGIIAAEIGTSVASVKHKYRRLTQNDNHDRYHHPIEKIEQIRRLLPRKELQILETNCGWGNLTTLYQEYGTVLAWDNDKKRINHIEKMCMADVDAETVDSFNEIHRLVWAKCHFDVIDLDPYGYPSRFFPHVFELIKDGYLFVTFPKLGAQKMNKITIKHLEVFWGIRRGIDYKTTILQQIATLAMQSYREANLIDEVDLGRMYRFAFKVEKKSALDLVGLEVNRQTIVPSKNTQNQFVLNFEESAR